MAFYDLSPSERSELVNNISQSLYSDIIKGSFSSFTIHFNDEDTYIRKIAYTAIGRIYFSTPSLHGKVLDMLDTLFISDAHHIRQTVVNAAGEIGKKDFEKVARLFDKGLFDSHHTVRNAVIGSMKKMGEINPEPILEWAKKYLHHPDKEIRREICHGIELRGRKYPHDILPMLKELQFDETARVRNTLVHVLGQIAYKEGCLAKVINDLKTWENKELVSDAIDEIIDVHGRYKNFSALSQKEAIDYIQGHLLKL